MSATDYFDVFDDREDDEDEGIECKYCGLDRLRWEEGRGAHNRKAWVLIDERTDEPHACIRHLTTADSSDFPPA